MRRPFAVIGFTVFVTSFALSTFGIRAAKIALPVLAVLSAMSLAVRRLRHEPVLVCSLLSATAACILFLTAFSTQFLPVRDMHGTTAVISAHLTDLPPDEDDYGQKILTMQTETVNGKPMHCKIRLLCRKVPHLLLTDELTFSAKLYASAQPAGDGVWLRVYKLRDYTVTPGEPTVVSTMLSARRYIRETLSQTMRGTTGAVLTAMLLGDRDAIPDDVYASMRRSGILHIFSVSGLHLSVVALSLLRVFDRRHVPRGVCEPLCAVLILFVMAVTGFPHSCVRAGLMLLLMLFGRLFMRRADAVNSLGFSLLLMCGVNPFCAGDAGLQLSAVGTLGVVCAMPYVEQMVSKIRLPFYPARAAVQWIVSAMLLSACIAVLTLPITAVTFGSVSIVAPLTNACMLWAAEWAMALGAFALPFSLWTPLAAIFRPLCLASGLLVRYCTAVSRFFGDLPFAAPRINDPAAIHWIAGTMLLIAAALVLRIPTRRGIAFVTAMSVVLLGTLGAWNGISSHCVAQIQALDVGNGTAFLVKSRGKTAMIGCGGSGTVSAVGSETSRIEWLLLPNVRKTEISCASRMLRTVRTDAVIVPEKSPLLHPVFFFGKPQVFAGETLHVGDVEAEFLPRDMSSAVRLRVYGRTVLMLFSPECDLSLLPQAWLSADVLVVRGNVPPALQAENYACVLVQGEQPYAARAAQDICTHGGLAVSNGIVSIQNNGFFGARAR